MVSFYQKEKSNQVEILAVNLTNLQKNIAEVADFSKKHKLPFPVLLDRYGEIADTYQAITIPTSYVIDSKGVIRKKVVGPMDKNLLAELIKHAD